MGRCFGFVVSSVFCVIDSDFNFDPGSDLDSGSVFVFVMEIVGIDPDSVVEFDLEPDSASAPDSEFDFDSDSGKGEGGEKEGERGGRRDSTGIMEEEMRREFDPKELEGEK